VDLPAPDYAALDGALQTVCAARGLQANTYFMLKTRQLYEMLAVRHGIMLVGQPFSGKSEVLHVLSAALSQLAAAGVPGPLFQQVQMVKINPKAVSMGRLYGASIHMGAQRDYCVHCIFLKTRNQACALVLFSKPHQIVDAAGEADKTTQEWCDGVLGVSFRNLATDPSPQCKWLVLDGPVDALWIENMNTVLDDNKRLCLPNCEVIAMPSSMAMIFEVGDLAVASPATVSRTGMVYCEPSSLGWRPLLSSWLVVCKILPSMCNCLSWV
jgi:dynein heavy chain, axonemal